MAVNKTYLVASLKSWNHDIFTSKIRHLSGHWHLVTEPEQLTIEYVRTLAPRYIFFLHWSSFVPDEITHNYECVNFHMTDLPYGRGGSPLQNLIVRGHSETKISALKMETELDAGPIYMKRDLALAGSAKEILARAAAIEVAMLEEIVRLEPVPVVQQGEPVLFSRRKPEQSRIAEEHSLEQLYDKIRMLDGEGYPPAFLDQGDFRYEFTEACLDNDQLTAQVKITFKDKRSL